MAVGNGDNAVDDDRDYTPFVAAIRQAGCPLVPMPPSVPLEDPPE